MKKILALFLLCSVLCGAVSCGGTAESGDTSSLPPTGPSDTDDTAPAELTANLPNKTFGGYEFRVLHDVKGWGTYTEENLDFDSENGDVLSDAIFRRNRKVEEQFGFIFTTIVNTDVAGTLTRSIMAGDDEFDIGMITYGWAKGTDIVTDFNTVPYIDMTKPWWNTNAAEQLTVGGVLTNALSDLMITHRDGTVAMFYNHKLAEEYGIGDLYQLVREGKWTLDKFTEFAVLIGDDLDGDDLASDKDLFGYSGTNGNTYIYLLFGAGSVFTENGDDGLPKIAFNKESFIDRYTKIVGVMNLGYLHYSPSLVKNTGTDGDQSIFRVFKENRALFMSHGIGSAKTLRDMNEDFGVLPAPKYDENQDSYYNVVDAGKYMVIPNTVSDLERTGIILEALAYEGYKSVIPSYYNTMLKNKFMRDNESIEMLDEYIFPNTVLKGFFYSDCQNLMTSLIKTPDAISSTIASNAESIQGKIDTIVETMINK